MNARNVRVLLIAALLALTAVATATTRRIEPYRLDAPNLEAMLPDAFGGWRQVPLAETVLPQEVDLKPGEAVAYRAYRDEAGRTVTLVVAYGPPLGDSVRLHRPETCYTAQGFAVLARSESAIIVDGRRTPVVNLDTQSPSRREAVTYWLRAGETFTTRASDAGWRRLKNALAKPLDGALVRASTQNAEAPQFDLNKRFLSDFAKALDPAAQVLLLGAETDS